ncbi:MAG TPA: AmmeMemoRadiSam system protein B [Verrucomicrobiae bacterium]
MAARASAAVLALALSGLGCSGRGEGERPTAANGKTQPPPTNASPQRVRPPAVAGLFYPGEPRQLSKVLEGLLEHAPSHYIPRLRALICPHAGYPYSGATAAAAYATLAGRDVQTAIILAPSHYAAFSGACVSSTDAYSTPLGLALISDKAKTLGSTRPFVTDPKCYVERPAWWRQAPGPAPEPGRDTPETWEHSAEVQVPFLQKVAKGCRILPVIFGETDPEAVAQALAPIIDEKTIVVASSDLSHYHSYAAARELDSRCLSAILALDMAKMKDQEACGKSPILALLHLARLKGWKAQLLDARNSGDATGEKERVVGYAGVAFYSPGKDEFAASDRQFMLELARKTVASAVTTNLEPEVKNPPEKTTRKGACFVTLTKAGTLRGCIGNLIAQGPLYQAIIDNARGAALRDPRFPPVSPGEVNEVKIEVSVLSEPQPLPFKSPDDLLGKLKPFEDGVLLRIGGRTATFLPQVWAQLPDKVDFLDHLAQKAGCERGAWRGKETSVSIYHVECFEEDAEAAAKN